MLQGAWGEGVGVMEGGHVLCIQFRHYVSAGCYEVGSRGGNNRLEELTI